MMKTEESMGDSLMIMLRSNTNTARSRAKNARSGSIIAKSDRTNQIYMQEVVLHMCVNS